jgi:hypothetical protein
VLVNTAKHIASRFPRSAVSAGIPAAAEAAGSMIGIGIEGFSTGYDIYQKHKELKEGRIDDVKFKKYIARRVTRGTMSVAGGMAGGILGQLFIPVPVVGAVVGSLVGGIVGAVAGHGEGILLGELVEIIDTKIKAKRSASKNNLLEIRAGSKDNLLSIKESNEDAKSTVSVKSSKEKKIKEEKPTVKYEVLDKLVFKFDRDIVRPGSFAHLSEVKLDVAATEVVTDKEKEEKKLKRMAPLPPSSSSSSASSVISTTLSTDSGKVVANMADFSIDDEDYEIYVLNDTNEIVQNISVADSLDENGSILKRKSLEAFSGDQLPEDLNVYFKIEEKS